MSNEVLMANVLHKFLGEAFKGPVLRSEVFDEDLHTRMHLAEFAVANGFTVPELAYGIIVVVENERNVSQSRCKVKVAPGYFADPSAPVFGIKLTTINNPTEFITTLQETQTIENSATPVDPTGLVWEFTRTPIDEKHNRLVSRAVTGRNSVIKGDPERAIGENRKTIAELWHGSETLASMAVSALVADQTNAYWGKQSDGSFRYVEEVRDNWFIITTLTSFDAAMNAYKVVFPSTIDMRLPVVLDSIDVIWNSSTGDGAYSANWGGVATGAVKRLSGSESGDAQGSASIQPELVVHLTKREGIDVPSTAYVFYGQLTSDTFSEAALLAKLTTLAGGSVTRWPQFKPRAHTLVLRGMKIAVQARASANANYYEDSESLSNDITQGSGSSYDVAVSAGTLSLPETIHGSITLSSPTDSIDASASTTVGWSGWGGFPSASTTASQAGTAYGAVSPTSLPATSPASIPSSGKYLVRQRIEPYTEAGWVQVYAEVIDAANIA